MLSVQETPYDQRILSDVISRQRPPTPGEERLVVNQLGYLTLEANERVRLSFSIQKGHVDVEEPHQGVRQVFGTRCASIRGPGHALGDAPLALILQAREVRLSQDRPMDARDLLDRRRILPLGADLHPVRAVELDRPGHDQLLQRPPSGKPYAPGEAGILGHRVVRIRHVPHVREADLGGFVPGIHRIDSFGQLRAARLVNAAGVDPYPVEAPFLGQSAALDHLGIFPLS